MRIRENMGEADRLIRTVVAIGLVGLVLMGMVHGVVAVVALTVGLVFLATSALSFCPLYTLVGMDTRRKHRTS